MEFLGRAPNQAELLASDMALPASVKGLPVRTTSDGPMPPKEALQILKDGNKRFVTGEALSGNVTNGMRRALVKEGQAPLAAIIGCADSRAPLETVFDAMPGDIFVLRNAGNTCTHGEGSVVGSLEFCVGALGTKILGWHWDALGGCYRKFGEVEILFHLWRANVIIWPSMFRNLCIARMVMVLGHTACGAIKGATATYLQSKSGNKPKVVWRVLCMSSQHCVVKEMNMSLLTDFILTLSMCLV